MKRSNAVLSIAESLLKPRYEDVLEEASFILRRLEKLGMTPPERSRKLTKKEVDIMNENCNDGTGAITFTEEDIIFERTWTEEEL